MPYGTLSVIDQLITANQPLGLFGEENAYDLIAAALAAHNGVISDMLDELVTPTAERLLSSGTSGSMKMARVDEFGAVDVQKVKPGQQTNLPMYLYQIAIGWTRTFLKNATTRDLAGNFLAARDADILNFQHELKVALFTPTNNANYIDRRVDNAGLTIRALLNADGQEPPLGPNGETFDGTTHTHYSGSATLTAAALTALLNNVTEHGVEGELQLWIHQGDEAAVRAMTGNFVPFTDPRINQPSTATTAQGPFDLFNYNNRAIGLFNAATVYVKPWMIANYQIAIDVAPQRKVLGLRTRDGAGFAVGGGALGIAGEIPSFPLQSQFMAREFGLAPINREQAAVLQSNNATYTLPSIP